MSYTERAIEDEFTKKLQTMVPSSDRLNMEQMKVASEIILQFAGKLQASAILSGKTGSTDEYFKIAMMYVTGLDDFSGDIQNEYDWPSVVLLLNMDLEQLEMLLDKSTNPFYNDRMKLILKCDDSFKDSPMSELLNLCTIASQYQDLAGMLAGAARTYCTMAQVDTCDSAVLKIYEKIFSAGKLTQETFAYIMSFVSKDPGLGLTILAYAKRGKGVVASAVRDFIRGLHA